MGHGCSADQSREGMPEVNMSSSDPSSSHNGARRGKADSVTKLQEELRAAERKIKLLAAEKKLVSDRCSELERKNHKLSVTVGAPSGNSLSDSATGLGGTGDRKVSVPQTPLRRGKKKSRGGNTWLGPDALKRSQHKRQSYVLYKGGRIDVENVWATELHPVSSFENKDTRMDKKPLAVANFATRDRRSSLAVTNDEVEIVLSMDNADSYVQLTPVYAFRMQPSPDQKGNASGQWLVVKPETDSVKDGSPSKLYTVDAATFESDFELINATAHSYAKVTRVLAVVLKQEAKLEMHSKSRENLPCLFTLSAAKLSTVNSTVNNGLPNGLPDRSNLSPVPDGEALGDAVQEIRLKSMASIVMHDPPRLVSPIAAAGSGRKSVSRGSTSSALGARASDDGGRMTSGSPGDYLVQNKDGVQWFVKSEVFTSLYEREALHKRRLRREGAKEHRPFSRVRNWVWRQRRPQNISELLKPPSSTVVAHLADIGEWDFDVFQLSSLSHKRPLYTLGEAVFVDSGLSEGLLIDRLALRRYLMRAEAAYFDNPYHNSMHGADVCQASFHFMRALKEVFEPRGTAGPSTSTQQHPLHFSPLELGALFLAALVHDLGHPGTNNKFQIASRTSLAECYNDMSVLEAYHAAEALSLLRTPKYNFLKNLPASRFNALRYIVIELILATDLASHNRICTEFDNQCAAIARRLASKPATPSSTAEPERDSGVAGALASSTSSNIKVSPKDVLRELCKEADGRLLLMKIVIKCADISHPARKLPLHKRWCELIQEEFYAQGDKEKATGLQVSPGMDRDKSSPRAEAKGNVGFIHFVVAPVFKLLHHRVMLSQFLEQVNENQEHWKDIASGADDDAQRAASPEPDDAETASSCPETKESAGSDAKAPPGGVSAGQGAVGQVSSKGENAQEEPRISITIDRCESRAAPRSAAV